MTESTYEDQSRAQGPAQDRGLELVDDDAPAVMTDRPGGGDRPRGAVRTAALMLAAAVGLWLGLAAVGMFLTKVLSGGRGPGIDTAIVEWFEANRTPFWDRASDIGSTLSDTTTCIVVAAVAFVVLRLVLGRWRESFVVVAAIAGELLVFLAVTATVVRDRPEVEQLDAAPPTSSFPSGHTAAAIALYGVLAVLLLRLARPSALRTIAVVLLFSVPAIVAVSRVYRGMHYPSDVVFGAIGGGLWLLVVVTLLLPRQAGSRR